MIRSLALLIGGGALLYFGAEWLVRGSAGLAAKLRVKPLLIGLTVVAYGTSAPELAVGITAAVGGRGGIAFGNAVGSNIANVGLILGVTALTSPLNVDASLRRRELPAMVLSAFVVPLLLLDGRISRYEGAVLLFGAIAYTLLMVRGARRDNPATTTTDAVADAAAEISEDARIAANAPKADSTAKLVVLAAVGLAALLLGGNVLVDGASALASAVGISERLIGLTIVAIGTSVPELATSLIAARRGHADLAVGNVIGSNIFNVLLILGASGVAGTLEVSLTEARVELIGLVVTTAAATFLLGRERISRTNGVTLLLLYVVFLAAIGIAPR